MPHIASIEIEQQQGRGRHIGPTLDKNTVQLWTDDNAKEFALRLSIDERTSFRVASDLGTEYNHLACEFELGKMNTNGWEFMLETFSDKWLANAKSALSITNNGSLRRVRRQFGSESPGNANDKNALVLKVQKETQKRLRPQLQCHFCRLKYFAEEERMAHEKMWHSAKLTQIPNRQADRSAEQFASTTS